MEPKNEKSKRRVQKAQAKGAAKPPEPAPTSRQAYEPRASRQPPARPKDSETEQQSKSELLHLAEGHLSTEIEPALKLSEEPEDQAGDAGQTTLQEASSDEGDEALESLKRPTNICFQRHQTRILQKWFLDNIHHPYLKKVDKQKLAAETGLTRKQITGWFTNNRKRKYSKVAAAAKKKGKDMQFVKDIIKLKFDKDLDKSFSSGDESDHQKQEDLAKFVNRFWGPSEGNSAPMQAPPSARQAPIQPAGQPEQGQPVIQLAANQQKAQSQPHPAEAPPAGPQKSISVDLQKQVAPARQPQLQPQLQAPLQVPLQAQLQAPLQGSLQAPLQAPIQDPSSSQPMLYHGQIEHGQPVAMTQTQQSQPIMLHSSQVNPAEQQSKNMSQADQVQLLRQILIQGGVSEKKIHGQQSSVIDGMDYDFHNLQNHQYQRVGSEYNPSQPVLPFQDQLVGSQVYHPDHTHTPSHNYQYNTKEILGKVKNNSSNFTFNNETLGAISDAQHMTYQQQSASVSVFEAFQNPGNQTNQAMLDNLQKMLKHHPQALRRSEHFEELDRDRVSPRVKYIPILYVKCGNDNKPSIEPLFDLKQQIHDYLKFAQGQHQPGGPKGASQVIKTERPASQHSSLPTTEGFREQQIGTVEAYVSNFVGRLLRDSEFSKKVLKQHEKQRPAHTSPLEDHRINSNPELLQRHQRRWSHDQEEVAPVRTPSPRMVKDLSTNIENQKEYLTGLVDPQKSKDITLERKRSDARIPPQNAEAPPKANQETSPPSSNLLNQDQIQSIVFQTLRSIQHYIAPAQNQAAPQPQIQQQQVRSQAPWGGRYPLTVEEQAPVSMATEAPEGWAVAKANLSNQILNQILKAINHTLEKEKQALYAANSPDPHTPQETLPQFCSDQMFKIQGVQRSSPQEVGLNKSNSLHQNFASMQSSNNSQPILQQVQQTRGYQGAERMNSIQTPNQQHPNNSLSQVDSANLNAHSQNSNNVLHRNKNIFANQTSNLNSLNSGLGLAGSVNIGYPSSYSNQYNNSNGSNGSHNGVTGYVNSSREGINGASPLNNMTDRGNNSKKTSNDNSHLSGYSKNTQINGLGQFTNGEGCQDKQLILSKFVRAEQSQRHLGEQDPNLFKLKNSTNLQPGLLNEGGNPQEIDSQNRCPSPQRSSSVFNQTSKKQESSTFNQNLTGSKSHSSSEDAIQQFIRALKNLQANHEINIQSLIESATLEQPTTSKDQETINIMQMALQQIKKDDGGQGIMLGQSQHHTLQSAPLKGGQSVQTMQLPIQAQSQQSSGGKLTSQLPTSRHNHSSSQASMPIQNPLQVPISVHMGPVPAPAIGHQAKVGIVEKPSHQQMMALPQSQQPATRVSAESGPLASKQQQPREPAGGHQRRKQTRTSTVPLVDNPSTNK